MYILGLIRDTTKNTPAQPMKVYIFKGISQRTGYPESKKVFPEFAERIINKSHRYCRISVLPFYF
jgi:hypothetical protein